MHALSPNALSNTPTGDLPADLIKDGSDATFMKDVMEASRTTPVLVDFWAPWCGPCKQLGPLIEKAVRAAKGKVRLVKIDTDKNPAIAGQLRIQSIPAVYAFYQGRPVDGFVGALPESQIKQFIDRLLQMAGGGADQGDDIAAALAEAKALLEGGDAQTAAAIYNEILHAEPEHAGAYAGLIECLLAAGQAEQAESMLAEPPAALAKAPELAAIRTRLELARQAAQAGPAADLERRLAAAPDDHQTRYDLALGLFAAGDAEPAMQHLLTIVTKDREWNEQAARKQLVKMFEALGAADKRVLAARRRLSSILFA